MTDDYVSFETARLLKEAGFDWPCEKWFELKGCTPVEWGADAGCNWNVSEDDFSRPTLSLAAKWLREVKNIHIQIYCTSNSDWGYMADIIGCVKILNFQPMRELWKWRLKKYLNGYAEQNHKHRYLQEGCNGLLL